MKEVKAFEEALNQNLHLIHRAKNQSLAKASFHAVKEYETASGNLLIEFLEQADLIETEISPDVYYLTELGYDVVEVNHWVDIDFPNRAEGDEDSFMSKPFSERVLLGIHHDYKHHYWQCVLGYMILDLAFAYLARDVKPEPVYFWPPSEMIRSLESGLQPLRKLIE